MKSLLEANQALASPKKFTKKEVKLKKLIKQRKTLRKLIKKKKLSKQDKSTKENLIKATIPKFTAVNAELEKPLKIEKAKAFGEDSTEHNVLKGLKAAAKVSSLKTWNEDDSSLLIPIGKKQKPMSIKRDRDYDDLNGIEVDSDEYNEEFDKPVNYYFLIEN